MSKATKFLVRSVGESFWRAGLHFTREGVEVDASELTSAQQEAITAEPQLMVSPVPAETAADDSRKKKS